MGKQSTGTITEVASARAGAALLVCVTRDGAVTIETGRASPAVDVSETLGTRAIVGLADAIVAHHLWTAIAVGCALIETPISNTTLLCPTGIVIGALWRRRRRGLADAALAGVARGAIGVRGAIVIAVSFDAALANTTLGIGNAYLAYYLATSAHTHFTGLTIL